jgi:hypothetical protein
MNGRYPSLSVWLGRLCIFIIGDVSPTPKRHPCLTGYKYEDRVLVCASLLKTWHFFSHSFCSPGSLSSHLKLGQVTLGLLFVRMFQVLSPLANIKLNSTGSTAIVSDRAPNPKYSHVRLILMANPAAHKLVLPPHMTHPQAVVAVSPVRNAISSVIQVRPSK